MFVAARRRYTTRPEPLAGSLAGWLAGSLSRLLPANPVNTSNDAGNEKCRELIPPVWSMEAWYGGRGLNI